MSCSSDVRTRRAAPADRMPRLSAPAPAPGDSQGVRTMVAGGSDGSRGTRRGQGRPPRRPRTGRPALGARIAATLLGLGGCVLAGLAGATGAGPLAAGDAAAGQAAVVSATPVAEAAHPLTRDRVDAWLDGLVPQLKAR